MPEIDKKVFDEFSNLVENSLNINGILSEDTIRYLFYTATIKNVKEKNVESKITLETPYCYCADEGLIISTVRNRITKKNRCSLDTFISLKNEKYALEFKYHHKTGANGLDKTIPHASYAGEVFNDLYRLSIFKNNINKYFVYISDEEMIDNYKKNEKEYAYRKLIDNGKMHVTNKDFRNTNYNTFNKDSCRFKKIIKAKGINYTVKKIYENSFKYNTKKYYVFAFSII